MMVRLRLKVNFDDNILKGPGSVSLHCAITISRHLSAKEVVKNDKEVGITLEIVLAYSESSAS